MPANYSFPEQVNRFIVFLILLPPSTLYNFAKALLDQELRRAGADNENNEMYTVKIKFEEKGLEPVTFSDVEPGQTLLELALKNDIELHHNCGGVCACTTCHIYIEKGMDFIDEITDREEDFIDRAMNPRLNSRLGCQSLLLDGDGEIEVTLPDQTQFLGE